MEEFGSILALAVAILWYVIPLLLRARSPKQAAQAAQAHSLRSAPRQPPTIDFRSAIQAIERGREQCDALTATSQSLRQRAGTTMGPVQVLGEVLVALIEEQARVRDAFDASFQAVSLGQFPVGLQQALDAIAWQRARVEAVEYMLDVRSTLEMGEMMADADAIAAAHLQPLVSFCQRRTLGFPHRRPFCMPSVPGREAVFFGLLPAGYPTLFVPPDFGKDLLRWPAVSHEIGHVVWRELPGLAAEVRQRHGLRVDPAIPSSAGRLPLTPAYAAWLEEIFCDFFAVLQLGPSALRGMIDAFSPPNTPPERLAWATVGPDGSHYEQHPPPHLRITLAAHALAYMGYNADAKKLMRDWQVKVGEQPAYGFPALLTPPFGVPAEPVEAFGRTLIEQMVSMQLGALDGFPLTSVPGLAMTPGLWARVREEVEVLADGNVRHDDPRVIISAAIEARAARKASSRRLSKTVTRAILGLGESRRPERDEAVPVERTDEHDEILEAMILYQVLERRPGAQRRSPRASHL